MVITVAHQKGGVGKSTIAANLAVMYSRLYGKDLRVIDLDMQRSLGYFNSVRQQSGKDLLPIESVETPEQIKNIINTHDGVLLIDVGGFDSDINRLALLGADVVITPVSDKGIELAGLMNFRKIIADLRQVRADLMATVLLNRVHRFAGKSLEEIFDFARGKEEFEIFETILRDRSEFHKAFDAGLGVDELDPECAAAAELQQLIGEINAKN